MAEVNAGTAFVDVLPNLSAFAGQLGKSMSALSPQLSSTLTKGLAAGLAVVGVAAHKLASDFESSMSKIEGLVGINREQVEAWGEDVLALATEMPQAPQELADALFFVTSAGFKGAEAMDVLEQSARAAAAGLGETKDVADAVTSAVNAYGIENLSAAQSTDILTATVREGKVEADQVAGALGRVIPIAQAVGVEFDEVGAAIAALTRTGASAPEAVTALRGILTTLIKPSKEARTALEGMGWSVDELREKVAEEGLFSALYELRQEIGDNQDLMGQVIPNVRALGGVLSLTGANAELNAEIFEKLADATGSADKAFAAAAKTSEFKLKSALSSVQAALIEIGAKLAPIAAGIAKGMQVAAEHLDVLVLAITALVGAKVLTGMIAFAANAAKMKVALLALAKAGGLFLALHLADQLQRTLDSTEKIADRLEVPVKKVEEIRDRMNQIGSFENVLHTLADPFPAVFGSFNDRVNEATQAWVEFEASAVAAGVSTEDLNAAFSANANVLNTNRASIDTWIEAIARQVGLTKEGAEWVNANALELERLQSLYQSSAREIVESDDAMAGYNESLRAQARMMAPYRNALEELNQAMKKGRQWGNQLADSWNVMTASAGNFVTELSKTPAEFVKNAKEGENYARRVKAALTELSESDLGPKMKKITTDAGDEMVVAWANMTKQQKKEFQNSLRAIDQLRVDIRGKLRQLGVQIKAQATTLGADMMIGMKNGIVAQADSVVSAARTAVARAMRAMKEEAASASPSRRTWELGLDLMAGLAGGIEDGTSDVVDVAEMSVRELLRTMGRAWQETGNAVKAAEKLGNAAVKHLEKFRAAVSSVVSEVKSAIGDGLAKVHLETARAIEEIVKTSGRELSKQLAQAQRKLEKLQDRVDEFHDAIAGAFEDIGDLVGGFGDLLSDYAQDLAEYNEAIASGEIAEMPSAPDATAFLQEQVAQAQKLAALLQQLSDLGLSPELLGQLAGEGTDAIPIAEALVAGGASLVQQFNAAQTTISEFAQQTADALAQAAFGEKLQRAAARVEHFGERIDRMGERLAKKLDQLANAVGSGSKKLEDTINNLVRSINRAMASISAASTRPMAAGGIVTRPTLALVGEAGPEAVIPLDQLRSIGSDGPQEIYGTLMTPFGPAQVRGVVRSELAGQQDYAARRARADAYGGA